MVVVASIAISVGVAIEAVAVGEDGAHRLEVQLLGLLPRELLASEVTVARGWLVDRLVQGQLTAMCKQG